MKPAHVSARPPAMGTAVHMTHRVLLRTQKLNFIGFFSHISVFFKWYAYNFEKSLANHAIARSRNNCHL